ncbi:Ig-like domain-containing protein [Chryseolinea sp. H1M3-3]|uniref:Ig-like domain-containing protein n=1 Tax=Chryseolinea sp. H1M3-3 TaxID=3034144 RepID=UPI0023ECBBF5|nr:Ig-like domain-containing protein [Chryseolinea sp. H1M3-3]
MKKLLLTIFVLQALFICKSYAQSLSYGGQLCAGSSINIYIQGGSTCSGPVITSTSSWTISPTPSQITYYEQSANNYPSIQVTWNSPVTATVRASYACPYNGSPDQTPQLTLNIGSSVTPSVTLANISETCYQSGSVILAATPTNGGTSPSYTYYVDGNPVYNGNLSSYNYNTNGLSIGWHSAYVSMYSNANCAVPSTATSSTKNFEVKAKSSYTAQLNGPGTICTYNPSGSFYVTVGNEIGNMTYQWHLNGNAVGSVSSSPYYTFSSLSNGSTIYCKVMSDYWCVNSPVQTSTYTVTLTSSVTPVVAIQVPKLNYCTGENITFSSSLLAPGYTWRLNGNQISTQSSCSLPISSAQNDPNTFNPADDVVTLEVSGLSGICYTTNTASASTAGIGLNVYPFPTATISPTGSAKISYFGVQNISASTGTNYIYQWKKNGVYVTGPSSTPSYTTDEPGTYSLDVTANNCTSTSSTLNLLVNALPIVDAGPAQQVNYPITTVTLTGTASDPDGTIQTRLWEKVAGETVTMSGTTTTTLILSNPLPGNYTFKFTATDDTGDAQSDYVTVAVFPFNNQNYVHEQQVAVKGVLAFEDVALLPIGSRIESYTYFDGLGRSLQSVNTKGSPESKDIVQPMAYDQYGRETKQYLPYVSTEVSGYFKANPLGTSTYAGSLHYNYHNNGETDKVKDDQFPYGETFFEPSPLNRPDKVYGVGKDWRPALEGGQDKYVQFQYLINSHNTNGNTTEEKVILWEIDASGLPKRDTAITNYIETGGYYSSNQLSIKVTVDEKNNAVREYSNKAGQIVLKKVQAVTGSTNLNLTSDWALTYYVYDDKGNLRFVFPPELSKKIHQNDTYDPTAADLENWAFQYKYDGRSRMIEKQVPGAKPVYMVYDGRDRLVLTQDGNQRIPASKEWTFIKYDAMNRPVLTGKYVNNDVRATVQAAVDTFYTVPLTTGKAWSETYQGATGAILGYTNISFPTAPVEAAYLTATYYDRYDTYIAPVGYTYTYESLADPETLAQQENATTINAVKVRGQVTAMRVRNLYSNQWMRTVNFYDAKYRLVQSISDHQKGTVRISNIVDFVGKVLLTRRTYTYTGEAGPTIEENPEYDHMGRLKWIKHSVNGSTPVVLALNKYNEMGQLVDKKLHSTNTNGTNAKQSVDYRYNIRGWLTRINDSNLTAEEGDPTDYFGINLAYNENFASGNFTITQKNYNGNISAIRWSAGLGQGTVKEMAYDFLYDPMNRLTAAAHKQSTATNTWAAGQFDENGLSYDMNGNIQSLQRRGEGGVLIDDLAYHYGAGSTLSNKLLYVKDQTANATDKVKGFNEVNAGDVQDYTYDDNGNMTRDLNKGIGTTLADTTNKVTYNFLNLPEKVTKGGNSIRYIYDATGRKLSQVTTFGAINKQVDYIGELQYENDVLQFINHSEGRIVMAENKLISLHNGETTSGITTSNASLSTVTQNGNEKYLQITSNGTVARTGASSVGGQISVSQGEKYIIRVKGYSTGSSAAYLQIKANGNDLNWPGAKLPAGVANESWIEQVVTIPAATTTLHGGLVWNTVTNGEVMFLNEFEIIKLTSTTTPEYQYHLKDHLGNVRVTFTTKQDIDQSLATLEMLNVPQERSQFIYYDEAVKVNAKVFDHSDQITGVPETSPQGSINLHIEAENYNAQSGIAVTAGIVGYCDDGDWLQYNNINMTGVTGVKILCGAPESAGRVEVRLGTPSGQLLGYMQGPNTGSWSAYSSYIIPLTPVTGAQNIVVLIKDAGAVINMDWLEFTGPGVNGLPVKGISLQNTSLALSAGQTGRLLKTITPAEATDQSVSWSSDNPSVATVNSSGVVTAVANGTAMITVTTASGGHTAKAVVRVTPGDVNMISNSEFDVLTGWTLGDWTGPGYSQGSNQYSAATVSDMSGSKAMFVDIVSNSCEYWTIQPYTPLNYKLEAGKTYEISFIAKAQSARTIGAALRGEQTNTDFWNTNVSLTTSAQTFGPYQFTCTDYAVTANTSFTMAFFLATCTVSDVWIDKVIVKDVTPGSTPATSLTVSPSALSLAVGQHGQITPTVLPANALNEVTWISSNTAIAVVNRNGLITALAPGSATITATSIAGNYTANTSLTVTAAGNNSVVNGEFDTGTTNWTLGDWTGPGYSPGGASMSVVTGANLSGTNALKVDVVDANNESWTLQPFNSLNFRLDYGHTYEISFMAKGQTGRDLTVALRGLQTNTDFWSANATLTTTAQTFGPYQFFCNDGNVTLNSSFTLAFYLAKGVISDVWLDKVIVKDITTGFVSVSGLSVSPSRLSLSTGQTAQLNRIIAPSNATNRLVSWTSSDTEIATVNNNGVVTAVSTGTAIITATSDEGSFTAQATISVNPGVTSYATRLTGMPNDKYGLAKSLSVMPGDTVEMEVYAKYLDNNTNNWTEALTTLMTQIAQGTAPSGTFIDGGAPGSIDGTTFPFIGVLPRTGETGTGPKAYLNYMIFDKNFVFKTGGFKRLSDLPKENGTDVAHEKLAFEGAERIIVKEPGYVYIYLSNENDTPVEVYFDDFKVKHSKGPIVSSQDYYPFGLAFNAYQRENSIQQPHQYNGKEIQDELNLQWMDYGARMYDAQIGRWHVVDPLSDAFASWNPYAYAYNNPIRFVDPFGMSNDDKTKKECNCSGEEVYRTEYVGKDGKKHIDIYYASGNSGNEGQNGGGNTGGGPGFGFSDLLSKVGHEQKGYSETGNKNDNTSEWLDATKKFSKTLAETRMYFSSKYKEYDKLYKDPEIDPLVILSMQLAHFTEKVKTGAPYDIKQPGKGYSPGELGGQFAWYNGRLMRFDDFGNYNYGAAAKSFGLPLELALLGAGLNQVSKGNADYGNMDGYFDHARDTLMIVNGFNGTYDKK